MIGASGAIAGVMGAYLLKFPRAQISTIIFFFLIVRVDVPGYSDARLLVHHSARERVRNDRVFAHVGVWNGRGSRTSEGF